jgi:predicted O-methyltransferase YrrM
MVLGAARQLFGRESTGAWRTMLSELREDLLEPPAAPVTAGVSHRVTLGRWIYAAVRVLRPEVVVETGVASGTSSWLILNALARNGTGNLHSIDLPNRDPARAYNVGSEDSIGQVVPDNLRSRWRLSIGDSRVLLPALVAEVGSIGLFFHDSEHSLEAMTREFETVLPCLRPGGLIVSDDVQKTAAFSTVVRRHGLRSYTFRKGGTARKIA